MKTLTQVKERPILFSGPMVKAILDGSKTQTRRAVREKVIPIVEECFRVNGKWCNHTFDYDLIELSPYGKPGDRLWVRETWNIDARAGHNPDMVFYRADGKHEERVPIWKPSIFMPRWACRIILEITDVRVERLQDISDSDISSEGIKMAGVSLSYDAQTLRPRFVSLWDSINAKRGFGWAVNPWVWVLTFKRIK